MNNNLLSYSEFLKQKEQLENEVSFVIEGVNIDKYKKIITVDLSHKNNVDTSISLNPTYSTIDGYPVISIFKRKKNIELGDGSPLIYALKDIQNWKIDKKEIIKLLRQFILITDKIKPKYDTIISIPSSNPLNQIFLYRLNKIIKCEHSITNGLFTKMMTSEVVENIDWNTMTPYQAEELEKHLEQIEDDYFTFKNIPPYLRGFIKNIWKDKTSKHGLEYASMINDKDVLILDDTISSGQTISTFCQNVINNYAPKSITIITLFSKL